MSDLTQQITQLTKQQRGGLSRSEAKVIAARNNGKLGGRPKDYERPTPPSFSYPGGKTRMAPYLIDLMPKSGKCYVEPFAGRGNVFFRAAEILDYDSYWLNDI